MNNEDVAQAINECLNDLPSCCKADVAFLRGVIVGLLDRCGRKKTAQLVWNGSDRAGLDGDGYRLVHS